MAVNSKTWKIGFRWTKGDASNPTGAVAVDTTSKAVHIADIDDIGTDWNVSTYSHPTIAVHSATTPATDYATLDHDATDLTLDIYSGNLKIAFGGTDELTLTSSAFSPSTSDGNALGTTALMWGDLFLASGGVVNFNNGDVTLTHASNKLTMAGGNLALADSVQINYGTGDDVTMTWDGSLLQILPATDDTGYICIGNGTLDLDMRIYLGTAAKYAEFDVGNSYFSLVQTKFYAPNLATTGGEAGHIYVNSNGYLIQSD